MFNSFKYSLRLFSLRLLFVTITLGGCLLIDVTLYYMWKQTWHDYFSMNHTFNPLLNDYPLIKLKLSKYAVCKSNLTKARICNKIYEGRMYVSNTQDQLRWSVFATENWGNTLSPYWQARGVAFLLGSSFECDRWNSNTWMEFLPVSLGPVSSNSCIKAYPELFYRMCHNSGPHCNMVYAHKCVGAWNHIRDEIQDNTRSAMERWAKLKNQTIPYFNHSQMVVYDRCSNDTILEHDEHGPLAYSAFQYIPKTVKILYQVYSKAQSNSLCEKLRQAQITYVNRLRPDITVISSPGSLWDDFSKLVYAPYVLIMSAGSSFALWSTLANIGQVWTPPLYGGMTPNVGNNYHWINTSILYPDIGKKFNFRSSENIIDHDKVLEWIINN